MRNAYGTLLIGMTMKDVVELVSGVLFIDELGEMLEKQGLKLIRWSILRLMMPYWGRELLVVEFTLPVIEPATQSLHLPRHLVLMTWGSWQLEHRRMNGAY